MGIWEGLNVILQEKYVGKVSDIKKIETQVGIARSKYLGSRITSNFYDDKELIKLGDIIASGFGFEIVDFNIVNDSSPNAYTLPVGFSIDSNFKMNSDNIEKSGYKFKSKNLSTIIRVTTGLWCNPEFTDGEVTGIILHEIGHNFQHSINYGLQTYAHYAFTLKFITMIVQAVSGVGIFTAAFQAMVSDSGIRAKVSQSLRDSKSVSNMMNLGSFIMGIIRRVLLEIEAIINKSTLGIPAGLLGLMTSLISNPVDFLMSAMLSPIHKGAENISDSFAADFGYGAELSSVLLKIELSTKTPGSTVEAVSRRIPVFNDICTLMSLPTMLLYSLISAHPITPKRAVNIVKDLESEMKKANLSPKMKKEIQNQIVEVKIVVDKYVKINPEKIDGMGLKRKLYSELIDYDKDPKGFLQKAFASKNIRECTDFDINEISESLLYIGYEPDPIEEYLDLENEFFQ